MNLRAPRTSIARHLLGLVWKPPLWAVPFGLFFGTIYGHGISGYWGAYLVSIVFAYSISTCMFVTEHVVMPAVIRAEATVGTRRFWAVIALHASASIIGSLIAAVIIHHTLIPGFLGGARQIVIVLTWAVIFTVLVMAIVLSILFYRRAMAHARSDHEMNLARRIQNSFLMSQFPTMPRLEIHAVNVSSRQVSGDFYDVVPAGEDAFFIAIADVAGKGVPAALLSSMLQASLRTQANSGAPVSDILRNINTLVYRSTAVHQFATFFLAHVDERQLRLSYSNAGHNHPVVIRRSGGHVALERGGTVLGILESARFEEDAIALEPGDRLVLYTDGISEAANAKGEMFGDEQLIATVVALPRDASAREITERILGAVRGFLGDLDPGDDMTLMVLRVLDAPAASDAAPASVAGALSTP